MSAHIESAAPQDILLTQDHILPAEEVKVNRWGVLGKIFGFFWPTNDKRLFKSQDTLLGYAGVGVRQFQVDIGNGNHINTVEIISEGKRDEENETVLVVGHGFGAGLGFFFKNFQGIVKDTNIRIVAFDWLGMGGSSRPPFPKDGTVAECENFFIDALEEWRKKMGLTQFIFLGHSLGGYLGVCYGLKYPNHIQKLVLASPAGIPLKPEGKYEDMKLPMKIRFARYLWDEKILTPQSFVRGAGPAGPSIVRKAVKRRFHHLGSEELKHAVADYAYHISAATNSGEEAFGHILSFGAWARNPLIERIHDLDVPTSFIYGEFDWMEPSAAAAASKRMPTAQNIHIIPRGGHHMYMENPDAFNTAIIHECIHPETAHTAVESPASAVGIEDADNNWELQRAIENGRVQGVLGSFKIEDYAAVLEVLKEKIATQGHGEAVVTSSAEGNGEEK